MRGAGKDPFSWIAVLLRWSHGERAARQDRAHDDVEKGFVGRVLTFASVLCLVRIRGVSRIAVLSDTHNRLPESVVAKINCADEIWHLGDVCFPGTLDSLVGLGVSLSVVHGNCDNPWDWKATMRLERHGRVFISSTFRRIVRHPVLIVCSMGTPTCRAMRLCSESATSIPVASRDPTGAPPRVLRG